MSSSQVVFQDPSLFLPPSGLWLTSLYTHRHTENQETAPLALKNSKHSPTTWCLSGEFEGFWCPSKWTLISWNARVVTEKATELDFQWCSVKFIPSESDSAAHGLPERRRSSPTPLSAAGWSDVCCRWVSAEDGEAAAALSQMELEGAKCVYQ